MDESRRSRKNCAGLSVFVLGCVLWATSAPALAAEKAKPTEAPSPASSGEVQQYLSPVIVNGRRNPLDESDKRLKSLKDSLPGLNSDGTRRENFGERFVDWYDANRDINNLSDARKKQLLQLTGKAADEVPPDLRRSQP